MPSRLSWIPVEGGKLVYRHTILDPDKPTVLCLHGLGDSSRVYEDAFDEPGLRGFNLVAPDLVGYGGSRVAAEGPDVYRFERQIGRLILLMDHLRVREFLLVGHSMGGDIGSLMCNADQENRIRAFVNIEGDLTQGDRFITSKALGAWRKGPDYFEHWLRRELIEILFSGARAQEFRASRRHYAASLRRCSAAAFWTNVQEIRLLNRNIPPLHCGAAALLFERIRIPRRFYWSAASLSDQSRTCLEGPRLKDDQERFGNSSHWIMLERREDFYTRLARFLSDPFS